MKGASVLSAANLYEILDKVNDAVFIDDAAGNTLWLNKACEKLYRISRQDVVGRNIWQLEEEGIFTPSVAKRVIEKGEQADIVHANKDGKRILSTGTPIISEDGEISLIVTTSRDITELINLQNELEFVQITLSGLQGENRFNAGDFVAISPPMREVVKLAERLASLDATVLITGESGVGKGLIAELLHHNGPRSDAPFVKINCGAIPAGLMESELFGYESGAFTGGRRGGKEGLFEAANGGSVFLDEISELPLGLQVKLLQVIQDRTITRVGGVKPVPVDVRIISASNRSLHSLVAAGVFREDLYYRLNVVPIHVPPLRERREDIPPLIDRFINQFNIQMNDHKEIAPDAMAILTAYNWPGNVRELQNIVERLIITVAEARIETYNLPSFIMEYVRDVPKGMDHSQRAQAEALLDAAAASGLADYLAEAERAVLREALLRYGSTRAIAKALGMAQPTVVRRLKQLGLRASGRKMKFS